MWRTQGNEHSLHVGEEPRSLQNEDNHLTITAVAVSVFISIAVDFFLRGIFDLSTYNLLLYESSEITVYRDRFAETKISFDTYEKGNGDTLLTVTSGADRGQKILRLGDEIFISALILVLAAVLPASDITADVETGGTYLYGKGRVLTFSALDFNDTLLSGKLSLSFTSSLDSVKGEVKGTLSYSSLLGKASTSLPSSTGGKDITSLSLDKAYIKFRFPFVSGKKNATVTVGKAPVSWGKGYYYRTGDVLLENEYDELEKSVDASRSVWLFTLDQNFGSGFAVTLGASIPLEGQKTILAMNVRKSISSDFLKGIYLSYAHRFDGVKKHHLSFSGRNSFLRLHTRGGDVIQEQ